MKRVFSILALVGLLTLTGCANVAPARGARDTPDRLTQVLARQELRVGLSAAQPPLNMKNRAGEIMGLEVDLARILAQSMNIEVRFVVKPFAELLDALEADEVDLVISGVTITPERNARVAFAGPYMVSGKSLLTTKQELADASSIEVLDDASRVYAALEGSTSFELVQDAFPSAVLVPTMNYDEAIEMVKKGEVDALVADFPICALSVVRYPDAGLLTLGTPFTIEPLGVALPADAPLFVNLVENYLNTLENTGTLVQLKAKWFSPGPWVHELP
jgi:polar amino acid transport system substrate-binding protein